jgi:hypothetical protein
MSNKQNDILAELMAERGQSIEAPRPKRYGWKFFKGRPQIKFTLDDMMVETERVIDETVLLIDSAKRFLTN